MKKWHASDIIEKVVVYIVLLLVVLITIYPILWMISGSLKGSDEFYTNVWGIPSVFHFENYVQAWQQGGLGQKYINSLIVTGGFLMIILPCNCCAAYAISRMRFKGRKFISTYLMMGIMIPNGVLVIPIFCVSMKLGLNNTLVGLILVYAAQNISFGSFLMKSFFISLPRGLEEAAMIDGCSRFRSFLSVILPLTVPGIMTQIVYCGLNTWNEYMLASVMIRKTSLKTLPLGLEVFVNDYNSNLPVMFAALVCVTLPLVIVYLIAQKTFIEGMTAGAVKG